MKKEGGMGWEKEGNWVGGINTFEEASEVIDIDVLSFNTLEEVKKDLICFAC